MAALCFLVFLGCAQERTMDSAMRSLVEAERVFCRHSVKEGMRDGLLAALIVHATEDVRLYRMGSLPTPGKDALPAILLEEERELTGKPMAAEVSHSSDLGYTYGVSRRRLHQNRDKAAEVGYLRIWKRYHQSQWRVVLDLASPIGRDT